VLEQYRKQVKQLAEDLNCRLDIDDKFRNCAMMYVESGYVEVPNIENQIDYIINLHELGHVHFSHTQGRPPYQDKTHYFDNGVLKSEAQAWDYAINHCIDDLQEATRKVMWYCLGSYYIASVRANGEPSRLFNGNRHHVEFIWDKPDSYFLEIVRKIKGDLTDTSSEPNFYLPFDVSTLTTINSTFRLLVE